MRSFHLFLIASILIGCVPVDLDARGFRGGGGGRVSRPPAPSRPAALPSSRPIPQPSSPRPVQRPASGLDLNRSIQQPHHPTNRSPSLNDRGQLANPSIPSQRIEARDRAVANPRLSPLFEGDAAMRRGAAVNRMHDAVRNAPSQLPANRSQAAAARALTRSTWGNHVRVSVNPIRGGLLNNTWINGRINRFPQRWFYWHRARPGYWWWRWLAWSSLNQWIVYDWGDPFYYDYGENPYYEDDVIFFNDEPVSSYDDFVASAVELANAPLPPEGDETDWESLGTWVLSTDRDHADSNMLLQLVMSHDGLISGTYYNTDTDNTQSIRGSVDNGSQRLSFVIGEIETTILETGLANLTQNEAPLWVHFTTEGKTQTWLLARLESPEPIPDSLPRAQNAVIK